MSLTTKAISLSHEGVHGREGTSNRLQFGRITKLEFPKFTVVDVKNWLYKCQHFFSVENVNDANKVKLALIHFFNSALVWHWQFKKINGNSVSWEAYQKGVLARFDTDFEDPLSELKNLKCDSTVQRYHEKFELLLNKVEMPEAHAISLFLRGMPQSISLPVRMFKPKSLSDTASLCKLQEATIAAHTARQNPILPKTNTGYSSFRNKGGYVASRTQSTPLGKIMSILQGNIFLKRSLMTKGPWYCVFTVMRTMEGTEKGFVMPEVTNEEIPQISLNALTGITSYRTMRVIGHFGKQKIHILIDPGSTHNFVDVFMAKNWMLHGEKFTSDVMLLPLGGCEMVLGVQWLATLGDIMLNFTSLRMQFQHEGRQMALSANLSSASLCVPTTYVMSIDIVHKPTFGTTENQALEELLKEFYDVFSLHTILPPQRHHVHRIPLKEGATPVNIRPYKHPPSQKDAIESMVQEFLDSKVIKPSNSPFSSPIVMVKKKDRTWRMFIEYRQLNKMSINDKFSIPLIE
ncbi:hypothetical protein Tco_0583410 [Tanacetum coccineum]